MFMQQKFTDTLLNYGEGEMNKENVRKRCQLFREGKTMVHGKD